MSSKKPRILLTNDDGIESVGLKVLADSLATFGEIWVAAPDRNQSGSSHSLSLHRPIRVKPKSSKWFSVEGTPVDCVLWALFSLFKENPPDLLISGVNLGANLGNDVHYSGTLSAAKEASLFGIPSFAISLVLDSSQTPKFEGVISFIQKFMEEFFPHKLSNQFVFNINIPLSPHTILEWEMTRLGKQRYASLLKEGKDPQGQIFYWIGGDLLTPKEMEKGTDFYAVQNGKISLTPITLNPTFEKELKNF